jgi:ABC-type transport system involved in cytochrome bd biosynthesis fused ATPase/permease subunit
MKLTVKVEQDEFTAKVAQAFDLDFDGTIETEIPDFKFPPYDSYNIGLIVGASGSGKSTLLDVDGDWLVDCAVSAVGIFGWERNKAIVSHFATPDEAIEKLHACGLASIPTLCKPYHVLSNGEKYRAKFARMLEDDLVMDEFTSEVNRETAKSLCVSVSKYIRKKNIKNIVLASCHKDIIDWLQPDWVFDCDTGQKHENEHVLANMNRVARITIGAE